MTRQKFLFDNGDFLNRDTIEAFVNYAKFCFEEFTEVRHWSTFNEIYPVATNQYLLGIFPPGIKYDLSKVIQCLHNMMYAHARVVNLFKDGGYQGEIGVVHSLETKYPATDSKEDKHAAFLDDALSIRFLLDATYLGYYSNETMEALNEICAANNASYDFLDSDFEEMKKPVTATIILVSIITNVTLLKPTMAKMPFITTVQVTKEHLFTKLKVLANAFTKKVFQERTGIGLSIQKVCMTCFFVSKQITHITIKIYITENGMGYKDEFDDGIIIDQPRIDYLKVYLQSLAKAIDAGVNVKGYFLWSLMDLFSWSNGYNKRYGLFYCGFETQKTLSKSVSYWYKHISDTKIVE